LDVDGSNLFQLGITSANSEETVKSINIRKKAISLPPKMNGELPPSQLEVHTAGILEMMLGTVGGKVRKIKQN